jgi:lipoate-protein ligase B
VWQGPETQNKLAKGRPLIMSECRVLTLDSIRYQDGWVLQKQMAEARGRDEIPDTLLLLEHPHVYTLGAAANASNILWSADELAANGVEVQQIDRGGDVTYHGPGQLVGYPILKLPRTIGGLHADVIGYIRRLETMLIRTLAAFDIVAFPYPGLTGVWVGNPPDGTHDNGAAKIAAIGVKVTTKAVTLHGFALNVAPDLHYFSGIVPCGIADKPVTSIAAYLDQQGCVAPSLPAVRDQVISAFAAVFECAMFIP